MAVIETCPVSLRDGPGNVQLSALWAPVKCRGHPIPVGHMGLSPDSVKKARVFQNQMTRLPHLPRSSLLSSPGQEPGKSIATGAPREKAQACDGGRCWPTHSDPYPCAPHTCPSLPAPTQLALKPCPGAPATSPQGAFTTHYCQLHPGPPAPVAPGLTGRGGAPGRSVC